MTKGEQARLTAWRLRVLQQAAAEHNVARVCRRFGISRKSFYKWKRRQAEHGERRVIPIGSAWLDQTARVIRVDPSRCSERDRVRPRRVERRHRRR